MFLRKNKKTMYKTGVSGAQAYFRDDSVKRLRPGIGLLSSKMFIGVHQWRSQDGFVFHALSGIILKKISLVPLLK